MSLKKLFLVSLVTVLAFSLANSAFAQKKGGKAAKAAPTAKNAPPSTPSGENENALDLNTAPPEKLMTLSGVDMIVAKKIIAARPFKNKNEIVSKKIMSQEDFNKIARSVTVKAAEKGKPKTD